MRHPLAVLIDAENISAALFVPLVELIEAVGVPIVWQLHGDFLSWPSPHWQEIAARNGIDIRQQFRGGKNASDIAMTIAAMDLLAAGKVKGFCLVSSDGDFTALARRLRADNLAVYGFGEAKAPEAFRTACTAFHVLIPPLSLVVPPPGRGLDRLDIKRLHELLHTVCREKGTKGRVGISTAASFVRKTAPDLAARVGGTGKFLKSLQELGLVETHGEGPQRQISVRFKELSVVR